MNEPKPKRIYAVTVTTPTPLAATVYVRAADAEEAKLTAQQYAEDDPCALDWEQLEPNYDEFDVECHGETEDQDVEPDCEAD